MNSGKIHQLNKNVMHLRPEMTNRRGVVTSHNDNSWLFTFLCTLHSQLPGTFQGFFPAPFLSVAQHEWRGGTRRDKFFFSYLIHILYAEINQMKNKNDRGCYTFRDRHFHQSFHSRLTPILYSLVLAPQECFLFRSLEISLNDENLRNTDTVTLIHLFFNAKWWFWEKDIHNPQY